MALSNHDRINTTIELLKTGHAPHVAREVHKKIKVGTVRMDSIRRFAEDPMLTNQPIEQ